MACLSSVLSFHACVLVGQAVCIWVCACVFASRSRVSAIALNLDIAPTLLDYAGITDHRSQRLMLGRSATMLGRDANMSRSAGLHDPPMWREPRDAHARITRPLSRWRAAPSLGARGANESARLLHGRPSTLHAARLAVAAAPEHAVRPRGPARRLGGRKKALIFLRRPYQEQEQE